MKNLFLYAFCLFGFTHPLFPQLVTVQVNLSDRQQVIDGFGAHQGNEDVNQSWWQELYYDDLGASIYRVDLTPRLKSPYSDLSYYSPWFIGSGTSSVFNLEDPDNPNGPEGNRVRTYTGPNDYSRTFGGRNAPIAVMGPDIEANVEYFTYSENGAIDAGLARRAALGDFKLIGSLWSPLPWVKVSSGNSWSQDWWPGPVQGSAWPFIWGGNFAGGRLDVSGQTLAVFDDSALGGTGPTSALSQFARSTAAYIRGYEQYHGVQFYAISIQNELNFEQFYNSATYPLSSQYITALKAIRTEFDKYDDLRAIRLMGPEDLLGGDAYGLWQFGGGENTIHKNLQYLQNIAADPEALAALDFFCIHGYGSDGVSAAGATSTLWDWWANGWSASPAPGIPADVKGFTNYGKKSWMTETSGEQAPWLFPTSGYPSEGAWGLALRLHQALSTGRQSAWVYWTFSESDNSGQVTSFALTNETARDAAPKYVAAKHFFRYIRPDSYRVSTETTGSPSLLASAYVHDKDGTVTVVLINTSANAQTATVRLPEAASSSFSLNAFTSSNGSYWQPSTAAFADRSADVTIPGYGVVSLTGTGALLTAVQHVEGTAPRLFQNQPNPVDGTTSIRFDLTQREKVQLFLTDQSGRVIRDLVNEVKAPGAYTVPLDVRGLPAGIYFYTLRTGNGAQTRKLVVRW